MLAEGVQGISDGFATGLRGDMDGMLNTEGIEAGDLTGSQRHMQDDNIFVFFHHQTAGAATGHLMNDNVFQTSAENGGLFSA